MNDSPNTQNTKPSLLLRLRNVGDRDAWSAFVDLYSAVVYGYCRRKGLQDSDAADVTQEVLLQVARSIQAFQYDPARGRFRDWLRTVTVSKLARFHRARYPIVESNGAESAASAASVFDSQPSEGADAEWIDVYYEHLLQRALEQIQPDFEPLTWQAFRAVWIEDRPANEVATALDLPIDAVYVSKSRVLRRLREQVVILSEESPLATPS